ncbi:hypothetical protein BT93_H3161 [Corymbia citriodora subsp. variegata]|nr:hypothetical protein BT93_H3161 [Corymbia citriodora subsp. variegata]
MAAIDISDYVKLKMEVYLKNLKELEQRCDVETKQLLETVLRKVTGNNRLDIRLNEPIVLTWKQFTLTLRGDKKPPDSDRITWETGQTSEIDDRIVRRRITSWQKGEKLGTGAFGDVYKGFTGDGFFFAVKEVSLLDQGSQGKHKSLHIEQEISLLSQLQHENIV